MKNGQCFTQNVFISDFFCQIRNQRMKIGPCSNFSQIGQKIRELDFRPENCLMTSYLPYSDDVSKIFMGLKRFCPRVPSCQVWW